MKEKDENEKSEGRKNFLESITTNYFK